MLQGAFVKNTPFIGVTVAWNQAVQNPAFILDTGFTGDLQVTSKIAKELGLETVGVIPITIANGQTVQMQTALAIAAMEGATSYVTVIISDSMPLAGIGLLTKFGYKAEVDCKYRTVKLERIP